MTKHIHPNHVVQHLWANQSQQSARTSNGNLWFDGPTLYSYSTPIANIVDGVALITTERYSVTTTGKHMPGYSALNGVRPYFHVPFMVRGGRYHWGLATMAEQHAGNLEHFKAAYAKQVDSFKRQRQIWGDVAGYLRVIADDATRYAACFKLPAPVFDPEADTAAIVAHRAERDAKNNTPQAIAKRERDAKRKAEREAEKQRLARASAEERQAAWRDGRPVVLRYGERSRYTPFGQPQGGVLLRTKGNTLETSLGATVPLDHAIKAFRFVKLCRERGTEWHRNGHSLRVGHFTVDRIAANGDFHAGCHFIEWSEVERLAKALGVFDETATDEALEVTTQHREVAA